MVPFFCEKRFSRQNIYMPANHGFRIRYLRESKRSSQFQLEVDAKLAPGMLSRIENNKVNPTKETLWRLAKALHLSLTECIYLFGLAGLLPSLTNQSEHSAAADLERCVDDFLPAQHQTFGQTD